MINSVRSFHSHEIYIQLSKFKKTSKLIHKPCSAKSKKVRRKAAKAQRKLEAKLLASGDLSALQPKIPITKQSIDLPSNEQGTLAGALEAGEKRGELRDAMRAERRKKIKEGNFLKGM